MAHLAARDPLWQLVAELCRAQLVVAPGGVVVAQGRLRAASETAADEASLLVPGGPDTLAGCLVALGRRRSARVLRMGAAAVEVGFRSKATAFAPDWVNAWSGCSVSRPVRAA